MNQQHEQIKIFITTLLQKSGINFISVEVSHTNEQLIFQINTSNNTTLIGTRGEVVRALNHITKKAFEGNNEQIKFLIDVNGYRSKKIEELKNTARLLAERARSLKYNVEMTPMSSYERMIVHSALTDHTDITTESHGEGRDRRVVIRYIGESE